MAEIALLDKVWTEFLARWPVEKVRFMTLEQYHSTGDPDCFVRWLESKARELGSVRSGSYFKYGIFQRGNRNEHRESGRGHTYGDVYAWTSWLGTTPEQAFVRVKEAILSIIASIQHRDLDGVQLVDNQGVLQSTITWKIAFLYQDRNDPQIVSVYAKKALVTALHDADASLTQAELYRRIMERRAGKNLHVYSGEIWTMGSQNNAQLSAAPASPAPVSPTKIPLNQILYGPPGTGKTYATVEKALDIFAQADLRYTGGTRQERLHCFNNLVQDGHIRFVTFHQSFCYEDFMEGIRAVTDKDGKIRYEVKDGIFKEFCVAARSRTEKGAGDSVSLPYVLIIDEINRGNVSRIFGELITLLEDSHRACLPGSSCRRETVTVRLPYSRDSFSVPENIYIIGTMNTADQSLTGLDVALRRRFAFTEMPPRPELLENKRLEGTTVTLGDVLDCLNQRIAALLDKEHCLGHAYFMGLGDFVSVAELSDVFKKHIMPLLEEYFFADWEKIQWVLNDHRKNPQYRFVVREESSMEELFGEAVHLPEQVAPWCWNLEAFENMNAYVQIVDAGITAENLDEKGMENLPGELIDAIDWEEYRIERYRSESKNYPIRIAFQGEPVGNITQTLKTIAGQLGITLMGPNTQRKGAFLMRKLREME